MPKRTAERGGVTNIMFSGCEWSGDYSTRRKRLALRAASDNNCAFTCNPLTPMKLYGIPIATACARRATSSTSAACAITSLTCDKPRRKKPCCATGSPASVRRSLTNVPRHTARKAEVLAAEAAGGDALIALLYALPTLIKRPVIVSDADVWLGLDARPLQAPRS